MEFYNEFKDLITGDYIDANGKPIGGAYSTVNDSVVLVDADVFQSLLDEVYLDKFGKSQGLVGLVYAE